MDSAALQLLNNRCLLIVFSFFLIGSSLLHLHTIIIGSFWLPKYFSILYKKKADCAQQ